MGCSDVEGGRGGRGVRVDDGSAAQVNAIQVYKVTQAQESIESTVSPPRDVAKPKHHEARQNCHNLCKNVR